MAKKKQPKTGRFLQVLEYMDGPQAVLLERTADAKIVAVAIDLEGYRYPFFGAEISHDQWERYKRGFIDLRYLFMFPRWKKWYVFDLNNSGAQPIELHSADNDSFAQENYVPEAHFFAYDHSENLEIEDRSALATQKYRTDGIWDLPDFSQFYNKITDLYSFFLALKKYSTPKTPRDIKRKIKTAFSGQPMKGGFSYVNLYDSLAFAQEFEDRLSIGKLRYASPGEVDVKGRLDVFDEMSVALKEFEDNYDEIKRKSNEIHKYLHENGLLKADKDRFDAKGPVARFLRQQANDLGELMKMDDLDAIYRLTQNNALVFAKVILAHGRRLDKYFLFFAEGRVRDPETLPGRSHSITPNRS